MGEVPNYTRQVAVKTNILELLNAQFEKGEGWNPTLAKLPSGTDVGRVNIMGTIVNKDAQNVILDDGTASISVRSFDQPQLFDSLEVGTIVLLIGKPRIYQEQKYIHGEICKKLTKPTWLLIRKKELSKNLKKEASQKPLQQQKIEEEITEETPGLNKMIYDIIKKRDTGKGAPYEIVLQEANNPQAEKIIHTLLTEGYIFEMQPGKLKVLD